MQTTQSSQQTMTSIRVWDAPQRIIHWLIAACFAGAYLTGESESWRLVHVTLGYTMAGLITFRVVWGIIGSRYARFSNFVRGPAAVVRYFRSLFSGHPQPSIGHNPAGAVAIVLMLLLGLSVAATGWALDMHIGGEAFEEMHEVLANLMLAVVGVHIAGVIVSSWLHRENLVAAMITGFKKGPSGEGIGSMWRGIAGVILILVLGFWWYQWQAPPQPGAGSAESAQQHDTDD